MALYKLFSYNVEIQYKSYLLSKATLFTILIGIINVILPFVFAYKSKGFWLQSYYFYEQPRIRSTYDYILIAETDDPSISIICGEAALLNNEEKYYEENCVKTQIQEHDYDKDGKNDVLEYSFHIRTPRERTVTSIVLILGLDLRIMSNCPLQMQSLAIINTEFNVPPNGLTYYGDIEIYQSLHLSCFRNILDTKYNLSLFAHTSENNFNVVDLIIGEYLNRDVITTVKPLFARNKNGQSGTMDINIILSIPEVHIRYIPTLLQELKWALPQYLSLLLIIFYLFERIKRFVFKNRLLMAWEITPWKKKE